MKEIMYSTTLRRDVKSVLCVSLHEHTCHGRRKGLAGRWNVKRTIVRYVIHAQISNK